MDALAPNVTESDSFFNTTVLFNASLKLAHRFLSLPSRALARLRRLDDITFDIHDAAQASQHANTGSQAYRRHRNVGSGSSAAPMPGPWGFFTSGYFFGLFVMAFLLHRIQNIVVPPRRPQAFRLHPNHGDNEGRGRVSLRQVLLSSFFPVDFSSTFSKAVFRVPSIYFLGKAVVAWVAILIQTQDPTFFSRAVWLQPIGNWIARKTMEDICWSTFMSACIAIAIGTLTSGFEGNNMNDNAPFNLFAFAFQLYVESASHLRSAKEGEPPSQPNAHVIITILLPLLQLALVHCLEIKHSWSEWRLVFSTAGGLLALFHFHYVFWLSPTPYPLTTYAARVVETIMFAVIATTVLLNGLTQLLSEGTVARPLFSHTALMPRWDEDFNAALFRLGTASMEATAVAGLGNEVGGVTSARPSDILLARKREASHGALEIDRAGVSGLSPGYEQHGKERVAKKGLMNEITKVKVKAASTDFWMDTVLNVAWQRHFGAFLVSAWRAARRVWDKTKAKMRRAPQARERSPSVVVLDVPLVVTEGAETDEDPYERFLRGEPVSDDEDDFRPEDERTPQPETPSTVSDVEDEGVDAAENGGEQAQLYADLSTADAASAPLLLAHMTDASSSPLTRRGYRELVSGPRRARSSDASDDWYDFVSDRREEKRAAVRDEDASSDNPHACVICTVEPRDIICWPCRCLALCDDCRNNLASRSSASKHTCPCCRRSVEGYSKIYIP